MPKPLTSTNRTDTAAERRKAGLNVPEDDPEATQDLAEVDTTQPLDQRTGNGQATVPARIDEAAADRLLISEAKILATLRQQVEQDDQIIADRVHIEAIKELVHEAIRQREDRGNRQLVSADLIRRAASEIEAWGKDRGVES